MLIREGAAGGGGRIWERCLYSRRTWWCTDVTILGSMASSVFFGLLVVIGMSPRTQCLLETRNGKTQRQKPASWQWQRQKGGKTWVFDDVSLRLTKPETTPIKIPCYSIISPFIMEVVLTGPYITCRWKYLFFFFETCYVVQVDWPHNRN